MSKTKLLPYVTGKFKEVPFKVLHNHFITLALMRLFFVFRDLNSGNVLVRSDLSCCICNFERSVCTSNTPGVSAEGSLAPVGTPRYLAPELLEVFSDQPSQGCSLKQADVYALGLLFWEISRRCHDLYQVRLRGQKQHPICGIHSAWVIRVTGNRLN